MPQQYSTGPALIWCQVGEGPLEPDTRETVTISGMYTDTGEHATRVIGHPPQPSRRPVLLGTAEFAPDLVPHPMWRHTKTSYGGDAADDTVYTGEEIFLYAELTWFSEKVYRKICSRPRYLERRGTMYRQSVGTFMRRSRSTYRTYVVFPFAFKRNPFAGAANSAGGLSVAGIGSAITAALAAAQEFATMKNMPPGYRLLHSYLLGPEHNPVGTRARKIGLVFHGIKGESADGYGSGVVYDHNLSDLAGATIE